MKITLIGLVLLGMGCRTFGAGSAAGTATVAGVITGYPGPVTGTYVTLVGSNVRTMTDADGRFALTVPTGVVEVVVGGGTYETLRLARLRVGSRDTLSLSLYIGQVVPPQPPLPPRSEVIGDRVVAYQTFAPARGPLYLIDDVPYGEPGDVPDLSAQRVWRIEMLSGAAAASRAGSRARGGMILVTTRK